MEESGDAVADVDEYAEVGEAIDRSLIKTTGVELVGTRPFELEYRVLLVNVTDVAVDRRATDDTTAH
jgi:hypothetical protein